ncbi:hypothetical protein D3C85_883430 [compost metagenome]
MAARAEAWPELSAARLWPTMETLQLWAQIVGKVRLSQTPWLNHGWHVTLRVSARGLTTGLIPHGALGFEMEFDFIASALVIRVSDGGERRIALRSGTVADFYAEVMGALERLGVACRIDQTPDEMAEATPFPEDRRPREYDAAVARDYWRALVQVDRVFNCFRTRFLGKCSPVHLFWGAFDLAVTRFSGRPAPLHPGGIPHLPDAVTREAYSHEVSSAGFWPGDPGREPAFYAYAYPAPAGFEAARVSPVAAHWDAGLGEFVLPYAAVRAEDDPDAALCAFLETTYQAAADLAAWDRAALECPRGTPRHPRWVG